jgi:hypothetical protein
MSLETWVFTDPAIVSRRGRAIGRAGSMISSTDWQHQSWILLVRQGSVVVDGAIFYRERRVRFFGILRGDWRFVSCEPIACVDPTGGLVPIFPMRAPWVRRAAPPRDIAAAWRTRRSTCTDCEGYQPTAG